ncbi:porin family protein [Sphingobacterium sp. DN00404]|uniref:Porin family protein n=1 Tax=Sphingobacterium micropteri TaxID=2763501 RepID=A0ABR7YQM7_9SPHI|nr:outer membrane beta-barrel protein [Sphingobacterium micropteri]MBD1433615.1 porin family protein [Sphingobacterium micropteri]
MKKFYLTLAAVAALTFASQAQTEKGKFIVGGGLGFDIEKVKDTDVKSNSFNIMPSAGYFVSDNIAVGLSLGYQWNKNEYDVAANVTERTNSAFAVAPFGRWYSANGPVRFFGQLSVPMSWGNQKVNDEKTAEIANYGVELAPGIAYFPTSKIGLEFKVRGLYFNSQSNDPVGDTPKTTVNSFGLNANSLAPTVGVQFYF